MKGNLVGVCALGVLAVVGCDRLERVVGLGYQAQENVKREEERQTRENQAEERKISIQAERESLDALISGKMAVLSNRVTEAEAALRALQADRTALSKELNAAMSGKDDVNGAALERALASPVVNELAMKYLHMDFSVVRGEYAEAIAKARESEAEFKNASRKLDATFEGLVESNPQEGPASRRARAIAGLKGEYAELERKRLRLAREKIPTGSVYAHQRQLHDRELRNVETRLREIEHQIDNLKTGDARERELSVQVARQTRERALNERNRGFEKLKRDYAGKAKVLQTVREYNEKTLGRLERALVKAATDLDESARKSREGCLTLQGIRSSVPKLSAGGIRKVEDQVTAL